MILLGINIVSAALVHEQQDVVRTWMTRRQAGAPIMPMDALVAAIARANAMSPATRNVKDFQGLNLMLVNPFEAAPQ